MSFLSFSLDNCGCISIMSMCNDTTNSKLDDILSVKVYESQYIVYLATSSSKRETIKQRTYTTSLPTNQVKW